MFSARLVEVLEKHVLVGGKWVPTPGELEEIASRRHISTRRLIAATRELIPTYERAERVYARVREAYDGMVRRIDDAHNTARELRGRTGRLADLERRALAGVLLDEIDTAISDMDAAWVDAYAAIGFADEKRGFDNFLTLHYDTFLDSLEEGVGHLDEANRSLGVVENKLVELRQLLVEN